MDEGKKADPLEPFKNAPQEIQEIIKAVLKLEKERLYQQKPHLNSDIMRIIKEVIK